MKQLQKNNKAKKNTASVGLKAFLKLAELWKLSGDEQRVLLGGVGTSTFYNWKNDPSRATLSKDTLERISYLIGIFKALEIILPDAKIADSWIRSPNDSVRFGGRTPLDRMLQGNVSDLYEVRQYLDSARGGW